MNFMRFDAIVRDAFDNEESKFIAFSELLLDAARNEVKEYSAADANKKIVEKFRAALGIAEQSDAIVLVVSEETGAISLAYDSKLYYNLSKEQLEKTLAKQLNLSQEISNKEEELDGN